MATCEKENGSTDSVDKKLKKKTEQIMEFIFDHPASKNMYLLEFTTKEQLRFLFIEFYKFLLYYKVYEDGATLPEEDSIINNINIFKKFLKHKQIKIIKESSVLCYKFERLRLLLEKEHDLPHD